MAARIGNHVDRTILIYIIIRTEGRATAAAVDCDDSGLGDASTRLSHCITRDIQVAAASENSHTSETHGVTRSAGSVTDYIDGLCRK